jgi:hypothetical protein
MKLKTKQNKTIIISEIRTGSEIIIDGNVVLFASFSGLSRRWRREEKKGERQR